MTDDDLTAQRVMFSLLDEWQALPRHEREIEHALIAIGAERHFQGEHNLPHTYGCWFWGAIATGPVPSPFLPRGES